MIQMSPQQLDDIIEQAAERGAKKALAAVGLGDEYAGDDVRGLRDLFYIWRVVRKTAIKSAVNAFMFVMLGALAYGSLQWIVEKLPTVKGVK